MIKVDFQNIRSQFEFFPSNGLISIRNIQGQAKLGGKITGGGIIQLGDSPSLNFRLVGNNLPGDSLAQIYNTKPPIKIGKVTTTALLTGTPGNLQTFLNSGERVGTVDLATSEGIAGELFPTDLVTLRKVNNQRPNFSGSITGGASIEDCSAACAHQGRRFRPCSRGANR